MWSAKSSEPAVADGLRQRSLIMRTLAVVIVFAATAAAGPSLAQDYLGLALARDAERIAADAAARQRDIALTNELSALQARVQSEQTLSDIAASRMRPALP